MRDSGNWQLCQDKEGERLVACRGRRYHGEDRRSVEDQQPMQIEKVLLIDDDPSIRKIAAISLSRIGKWQVVVAESGTEALEIVSREKPDIILLDVMMPGMDGPTTLKLLRERRSINNTPVIFMTAKLQKHEVESYCLIGAAGVIAKPFDPLTLASQIRTIMESVTGEPLRPSQTNREVIESKSLLRAD